MITKGKKVPVELEAMENENLVAAASQNAWMTEDGLLKWIERVWRPYSMQFEKSLLILDKFRVHTMPSVLEKLKQLNTDVLFIPAGLTFLLQPCDVYVNKPIKEKVRASWERYMLEQTQENSGNLN